MFLTNAWYVAAWAHEVTAGSLFARRLLGEDVVLYRRADGTAVAMVDRCCHRLAPLSKGRLEGDNLRCMYHGLLFAPDGVCLDMPQGEIPRSARVRTFPVIERDRYVWVWLGDAGRADPALVPDAHWQDDPGWRSLPRYTHFPGVDYRLIVDNLLDFSHLGFVHENSLGGGRSSAEVKPEYEFFDWGVRITRWYFNDGLPPYLKNVARFDGPVDRWQIYEWRIAGNMLSMDSGSAPAGTGAPEGRFVPETLAFHSLQSITPEDSRGAHYFWTHSHNFELDKPEVTLEITNQIAAGFAEDKAIISAQQAVIDRHPDIPLRTYGFDLAIQRIRQQTVRMIEAERGDGGVPASAQAQS